MANIKAELQIILYYSLLVLNCRQGWQKKINRALQQTLSYTYYYSIIHTLITPYMHGCMGGSVCVHVLYLDCFLHAVTF